jgi:hypothetical protein
VTGSAGELYRPFRLEWFATAVADRCSYYLCLANGAMFYHRTIQGGGSYEYSEYEESAQYFGRCTALMAQRLDCPEESVSEGAVTTVLGFLCHDVRLSPWQFLELRSDMILVYPGCSRQVGPMVYPYRWSSPHGAAAAGLRQLQHSYSHVCFLV